MTSALALGAGAAGCKTGGDSGAVKGDKASTRGGGKKLEYPVEVAPLAVTHVQYTVTAPGSIEAFQQVQITARVSGAVDKVSFAEGASVTAGQTLVSIESDRYQVAVDQAKAQLQKSQAEQKQAQDNLARRQAASEQHPGLIAGEEMATYQTSVTTAMADVAASQQAVRVAQLNLRDAFVTAPIAGIVQTRTVQTGQYLQPGSVLATILQRDPLILRFQASEQDAPRLKVGMKATVSLRESAHTYTATITLIAGAADPATRLVPVTGTFDTTDQQYWLRPGAFCNVTVPIGTARDGIVVPAMSIQPTEKGNVAYVVEGGVAKARQVELGMHTAQGGVEITRGLNAGDQMIVRGIDALTDGAPVKVEDTTTVEAVESADGGAGSVPSYPVGGGASGGADAGVTAGRGMPGSSPGGGGGAGGTGAHSHPSTPPGTPAQPGAVGAPTGAPH
jgi:RND family efflux transporter MFP subunit